ncbi:MAG: lamin tail domain-containing protein, partial [Verrucomicrobiales bacterium]|nr:lamin tail domain-containing protein [Verrucomicrobiales bacterium]
VYCSLLFVAGFLPASGFPDPGSLTGAVLGEAPAEGSVSVTNATVRMVAKGAGLGGRGEQGYFAYTGFGTNDFDFAVRVSGLEQTALSARAGLMVRGDLATAGVMAAIVVTPGMNGVEFLSRLSADGVAAASGGFPANLPYAWLRLRKTNDVVTGFASYDGRRWMAIGRAPMVLTNALVGLAASSASAEVETVATFADWGDVKGETKAPVAPPVEPPGPSSRRTLLAMTEIHYNPVRRVDEGEVRQQFVELQNTDFTAKEMRGHRLEAGRMKYAFPADAVIPAGGYVVVAQDPALFRSWHPEVAAERVLGPWEGELDRDRDAVRLWSSAGALVLEVPYTDREPWPLSADGEGHTLVLARPSWGEEHPRAWAASQEIGGSPGRADGWSADAREGLRITEVVGVTEGGVPSFVEIFNAGADPAPLRGVIVAGALDVEEPKLALPDAELDSGGRMLVEVPGGVGLPSPLFLRNGQSGRVFDAVTFRGAATNAPFGRPNLDRAEMRRLASVVADPAKRSFRRARLVISEVMYEPITGRDDDQYLEIWNPGGEPVLLTGWRLADGVEFEFPAGRRLGPGERGIVARNAARLRRT